MKPKSIGISIIASAIIWGVVIVACSFRLKDTGCYDEISLILAGGAGAHLLFIWGPLSSQLWKKKEDGKEIDPPDA